MNFRIADTFTDSLTKLTGDEQKSVKTTAFDLQLETRDTPLISQEIRGVSLVSRRKPGADSYGTDRANPMTNH
jgi:hypothetical protein